MCVLRGAVAVRASINLTESVFPPGSEIRIPCDVSGYPVPRVTWYKDSVPVQTDDRRRVQGQYGSDGVTLGSIVFMASDLGDGHSSQCWLFVTIFFFFF